MIKKPLIRLVRLEDGSIKNIGQNHRPQEWKKKKKEKKEKKNIETKKFLDRTPNKKYRKKK